MKETNIFASDIISQLKRLNNQIKVALFISMTVNVILVLLLLIILR